MSSTIDFSKGRISKRRLSGFVPALLLMAAAAHAEPASIAVKYGDLNLKNADDAKRLYARLGYAAERVCKVERGDLSRQAAHLRCVENALSDAVAQVQWQR